MDTFLYYLLTNDVECFSFETNSYDAAVAEVVAEEAMPKLLDLYKQHSVKSTFFFTAQFAQLSPRSVTLVVESGHEVACHGYDHLDYYDRMDYEKQVESLRKSKEIIEDICGKEVVSFRAPALRINKHTVVALENSGFKYDSSIASQRFDGLLTTGVVKKLDWLLAPRKPYYLNYENPSKKGYSSIMEIPISAFIWPLTGTHLRLNPFITKQVQRLLMREAALIGKPIVFLFHPNESLECQRRSTIRRGNWFSDNVRHNIKMKNLGESALYLLESLIRFGKEKRCIFTTLSNYGNA
jgi:peptidoglycan/xylan/chitin deacetylase (PgdA/CDA1 family)